MIFVLIWNVNVPDPAITDNCYATNVVSSDDVVHVMIVFQYLVNITARDFLDKFEVFVVRRLSQPNTILAVRFFIN